MVRAGMGMTGGWGGGGGGGEGAGAATPGSAGPTPHQISFGSFFES